jgi:hypothetical protein
MLQKYPYLRCPKDVLGGEFALSFELYGYRNPILVQYKVPLDTRLLFGIRQNDAGIVPPEEFAVCAAITNAQLQDVGNNADLSALYEKLRQELQDKNKVTEENLIEGQEGCVFYVLSDERKYSMWKLKPEMIEKIHWASGGIDKNSILTTAKNALENVAIEELTVEFVCTLLKEEFSDTQIGVSMTRIHQTVEDLKVYCKFKDAVMKAFQDCSNRETKRDIMRFMSNHFSRDRMKHVFNVLKEIGAVQ